MINFNYKRLIRNNGTSARTPSIPIILKSDITNSSVFETFALLDSGADESAIPFEIAEYLGLDINGEKSKSFGLSGSVDSIDSSVSIVISKGHEKYQFRIPVKVICAECDFTFILGRFGFFDKFVITFDEKNEKISLKKNNI